MRMHPRGAALVASILVLATVPVWSGAVEVQTPGDPSMWNLEHVYNYNFKIPGELGPAFGADLEFYTSTVPLRNYATGELITDTEGNSIDADRDFAVVGAEQRGAYVFDVTDPEHPQFVTKIRCVQKQNDPQLKRFGSRWILALTQDGLSRPCLRSSKTPQYGEWYGGVSIFDVTDPYANVPLYSFGVQSGAHNFTWHPTAPYGWVSLGDIPGDPRHDRIPIIDFHDLVGEAPEPVLLKDLPSVGSPHDISFNADGTRAYVAGAHHMRIYDTTDPANPALIGAGVSPGTYAHTLEISPDERTLVLTEESLALGGFFASSTTVCPGEGLMFWDATGELERAPVALGHFLPPLAGHGPDARACTAHQGRIAPNSHVLSVGWYIGGVRVVDFADPHNPREVAHAVMPGTEVWSARFYKGPYIYTGDQARGFDVFRWSGQGPAPWVAP